MAPLTLPEMGIGSNTFTYTDESPGARRVQITHQWVERSASRPPEAPAEPIFPPAGGTTAGTAIAFQWRPAADPDGDAIADYHFELSARADMKWPLSMSFAKLISRTADAGQARYTLPGPGLLNPGTTYYWHVRAKDGQGVWGPWSPTWSFTPGGPAPPQSVRLEFDRQRNRGVLRWAPNPLGRKPVAYRVYASDEKGFSVSDTPYKVTVGVSQELPAEFPANFVAETSATELEVVGPQVRTAGGEQGLLPSGRRRRGGQSQRAFRLRRLAAAAHRQRACDRTPERGGLSLSARGHPIARRSADAGRRWQGNDELLGRRAASLRDRARPAAGSRSTRRPACSRARPIDRARPRWSSPRPSSTKTAGWTRRHSSGESKRYHRPASRRGMCVLEFTIDVRP